MKKIRRLCAWVLSLAMLATMFSGMQLVTDAAVATDYVSRLVTNDYGTYVEHNGKPYLMYGVQMRVDKQYAAKIVDANTDDWSWIEENFQKVVEDGFKTVAIPVYWSFMETGNHGIPSTTYIEKMYDYIYKYDLTVQWLWFGSNVCGQGTGTSPWYVISNPDTYSRVKQIEWTGTDTDNPTYTFTAEDSSYFDFSDADTMQAEQDALAAMMAYIAKRDTEKRCVMIQINNEIDQGGEYWQPKKTDADGNLVYDTNGNPVYCETGWDSDENHKKYFYAFGQRDALFAQLDALGDVVHNSGYNCVTRINLTSAGRPTLGADDYTDLLGCDGIDIVGIDDYDTTLSDIEKNVTFVEGNATHLAESSATYDSSINTSLLLEKGIGNFIYCHRTDHTGGGMYQQEVVDGAYNIQYKEWVERESTPAIREFNNTINKAYEKAAYAVSKGEFAALTADGEVKSIGSTSFTLSDTAENDKLALALQASTNEYVLMSVKNDCEIAVAGNTVVSAEVGYYNDNGVWVKEHNATVDGGNIAVEAGDAVLVKVLDAVLDGTVLADTGTTLENGAKIYKASENGGKIVLDSDIKDFAVEFKYMDVADVKSNPTNLNLNMRGGKYSLAIHNWATLPAEGATYVKSHDLRFLNNGKTAYGGNGHFAVEDNIWTQFKVIMAGQRVTVLKNGTVWYSADLLDEATSGALELTFSGAYETYIADITVTTADEKDTYTLIDADLQSELFNKFKSMPVTYSSDIDAAAVTNNAWSTYTIASNIKNYEFNIDFQYVNHGNVRGVGMISPSGYRYLFINDGLYVYAAGSSSTTATKGFTSINNDGKFHSAVLTFKNGVENVYLDGKLLYSVEIGELTQGGDFKVDYKLPGGTSSTYIKNIKLVETSNLSRTTAVDFPELDSESYSTGIFGYGWANDDWESFTTQGITGAKVVNTTKNGRNPMFDETATSSRVLSMKIYMDSSETANLEFYMRGRLEASSNGFYVNLKNNYCQVNGTKSSKVTFEHSITDRWIDLEMYMFNTNAIVVVDGVVVADFDNITYDFTSSRRSWLISGANSGKSIAVADIKLESLDGLMNSIEKIDAVTFDENGIADETLRADAISSYTRLYSDIEKYYLENHTNWFEVYYDYGDVNADGNVDAVDLVRLKKIIALVSEETVKSDIDRNGTHAGTDLTILRNYIMDN